MKKLSQLLSFMFLFFACTCFAADNTRRFEIVITDFYFPLLSEQQNLALREQILNDQLTIAGAYIAQNSINNISYKSIGDDAGDSCFWNCKPMSHQIKTVKKHIIRKEQAQIINLNPSENKVIFELPSELEKKFLLDTIYFAFPLDPLWNSSSIPKSNRTREKEYMELHIPISLNNERARFNHYKLEPRLNFAVANVPYSARIRLEDEHEIEGTLGMVVQINLLDEQNQALPTPLLPDFNAKLPESLNVGMIGDVDSISAFGPTKSEAYNDQGRNTLNQSISIYSGDFGYQKNFTPITLPKNMSIWQHAQNIQGELIDLGYIKIIRLQGQIPYELGEGKYKTNNNYLIAETWIQSGDQITKIYGMPDENWSMNDQCYFAYQTTFSPDGHQQLYFTRDNRSHVFFTPLENNDISPLLDFDKRKEDMTFKMPSAIKACRLKINHAKRLFHKTQAELNQDFAVYKKALEHAQKL